MLVEAAKDVTPDRRTQLSRELLARAVGPARATETQQAWKLLIAGYLYLGGLGAGAFVMATAAGWLGLGLTPAYVSFVDGWAWDWSKLLVAWGPFVTALGAALLVFHLGLNRWRFWSAGLNPRTSWMARGFWILLSFIVLGAVVAMVSVFLPAWPDRAPSLWRALEAVAVFTALGTAVYTGILLRSMQFIPAWRPGVLPLLFLASAISTGSMGIVLSAIVYESIGGDGVTGRELVRGLDGVEPFVLAAEAVLLAVYIWRLRRGKPAARLSSQLLLTGRWRSGFWAGIVGLALVLPLILVLANAGRASGALAVVAAFSALAGGFLLRSGVLAVGIIEAPPHYRLALWRASRPVPVSGQGPMAEATE